MAVEHGRDVEIMLVFDDDGCVLSETQKSNGLTRTLHLENICPNDIHLSINGFSLLPFEQTCELNNKVIRCVKKTTALPIDKVTGGCLSDIDRSEDSKKRKASAWEERRILNNKKPNCTTIETSQVAPQHNENEIHVKQNEHLDSSGSDQLADGSTEINRFSLPPSLPPFIQTCSLNEKVICKKKIICNNNDEASPGAPQHAENDIHVKQNEHLDSPGSDELADRSTELNWDECMEKLSEKSLGMSAGDVYLMRSTCCATGRHYGPMSILYHIRRTLLSGPPREGGVANVGIKILLDKVKDSLKGLQDVDVNYYESKSTETSRNDDPAVEPAVDAEGSKKSMDLDDTEGAQSFESIQPSGGALKFAQGIVAFCKLLSKEMFHPLFLKDIEFHDVVLGIIDDIITADDLARAHQLFEDEYADKILWEWSDDEE